MDSVLFLQSSLINEVDGAEKVQAVRRVIYGRTCSREGSWLCFLDIRLWKERKKSESGRKEKGIKAFLCL